MKSSKASAADSGHPPSRRYFVYILRCSDNTLYTGWTTEPEKRLRAHNAGKGAKYTRSRLPVALAYLEEWPTKVDACRREVAVKALTRTQKLRLVEDFENNRSESPYPKTCGDKSSPPKKEWSTLYSMTSLCEMLERGAFSDSFRTLYPTRSGNECAQRYRQLVDTFASLYGDSRRVTLVSAPGRTEIGGNHTDHQHGRVLAGAVDLDIACVAARNSDSVIRIHSKGHLPAEVKLDDLSPTAPEQNTTAALIRGVADWFVSHGHPIGGLDAVIHSEVLVGSGLSSSAAFEVAMGGLLNHLYCGGEVSAEEIARAGQYAENVHFGKPSGLMDQMASSVGALVQIDFSDPERAVVEPVRFDFAARGIRLCIVDTKGSHADLTHEYAAIPAEMGAVAAYFGKPVLREVTPHDFYPEIPSLRERLGDRAVLRAMHFFAENDRVPQQADALKSGDLTRFLALVTDSGQSSASCLQNIYASSEPARQEMSLALALSREILAGRDGAWRVHGGGFAGTIQAFVPDTLLGEYRDAMERVFGAGSCHVLSIRPVGGVAVTAAEKAT